MKNYLLALALLAGCFTAATAQLVGTTFPSIENETVEDKVVTLPKDAQGRITLVAMAYSKKAEKDLSSWLSPLFNTFIKQKVSDGGLFASFAHDIDVYIVPMFTGIKAAAQGTAKRKAAKNLDARLIPYVLFYKGKLKPYKEALEFDKKDVPYLFLLDQEGKIVYATSGAHSSKKMSTIEEAIDAL
ncbi:MAG: hypothetical protein WA960_11890 [Tunicatimonas sp.]